MSKVVSRYQWSQQIRQYYHSPYFGAFVSTNQPTVSLSIGSQRQGMVMAIQLVFEVHQTIQSVRIQAFGSPYVLAVLGLLAETCVGQCVQSLPVLTASWIVDHLNLPEDQLGVALLAEDLWCQVLERTQSL